MAMDWYLVAYDIRDPRRWRQVHKLVRGSGERLQYSLFRCRLSAKQMEALRWELERELEDEDDLLIIRLPPNARIIDRREGSQRWDEPPPRFEIV